MYNTTTDGMSYR